ncbi:PilN domain-containing protein [Halomonas sp. V046]|uniref:PilN domain-containing protein n=1 Tax=Halomonas sp. V046 TaxID=3459611 RepID=UPI004043E39C
MKSVEINLLPWREAQRSRRGRAFGLGLGAALVLGGLAGMGVVARLERELDSLGQRRAHIEQRVAVLDNQARGVVALEQQVAMLRHQQDLFRRLQASRPQAIAIFNALAATLGAGVRYLSVERVGDTLRLVGEADSNAGLADQLRALASAEVFSEPTLESVAAEQGRQHFTLSLALSHREAL